MSLWKVKVKVKSLSRVRFFATPWIVACTRLLRPWGFQGKTTGVGCHFLLQGIFPTQGSNPGLSHYRQTLYHLSHQGSLLKMIKLMKNNCDRLSHLDHCWIIENAREFQKNIYFCFIEYAKAFDYVDHNKLENSERDGNTRPPYLSPEKSVCRSRSNS